MISIYSLLLVSICFQYVFTQVSIYGQCGGSGYTGSKICATGLSCFLKNQYYAQCLTSCPAEWECNGPLIPLNGQCGGNNHCGLTQCAGGLTCFKKDPTLASCLYSCPAGWECNNALLPEYSQCGGIYYTGSNSCSGGLKCFQKNEYYSQCLYSCPQDWNCTNCIPTPPSASTVLPVFNKFLSPSNQVNRQCIGSALNSTSNDIDKRSIDWRSMNGVSPVKNQLGCNACWAFAATASIESQYLIQYGINISISEQNLIDCSGFGSCYAGFPDIAFNYIINQEDVLISKYYPYIAQSQECKYKEYSELKNMNAPTDIELSSFSYIFNNEISMQQAIYSVGPIVVFLSSELLNNYTGGIIRSKSCSKETDHVALAVGFGNLNGLNYYIVKNSWGTSWGENGFFRIAAGVNMCGIGYKAMYPILYTQPENCQCGGVNYIGQTQCDSGLSCFAQNSYFSQCLANCPSGWLCQSPNTTTPVTTPISNSTLNVLEKYSQCGGIEYNGSTICGRPNRCYAQNKHYSQCISRCPLGWSCQSSNIASQMDLWKKNNYEIYFYKLNTTTWSLIEYANTIAYLQFVKSNKDSVVLYNAANKLYYNLNSSSLMTGISLNDNYSFNFSGSWISYYYQTSSQYGIWSDQNSNYFISLSPDNNSTWVQFNGFNNYILQVIELTSSQMITFYNGSSLTKSYVLLNSNSMHKGNSSDSITNFLYSGYWTSFCPGFSIYGPSVGLNSTSNTVASIIKTTTKASN